MSKRIDMFKRLISRQRFMSDKNDANVDDAFEPLFFLRSVRTDIYAFS